MFKFRSDMYDKYLRSHAWRSRRDAVMLRSGGICEFMIGEDYYNLGGDKYAPIPTRCTARAVDCHHLTYDRIFNERLEDLRAVCGFHHTVIHVSLKSCELCGNDVFDGIDDAAWYVKNFETYNECISQEWLYANIPTLCSCCDHVRKDDLRRRKGET